MKKNKKFISWRRVSTFRQSKSGLGLEAQKEIIRYFVERDGGELIADFSECYTGKELSGCKELRKAMACAKETGAILVIAKSDRFRNCQEALGILNEMGEGNIEFCDLPHSDRFTLTLFWALAEREALITSIRTKQALAVKKAQGCKMGASNELYRLNYKEKTESEKKIMHKTKGISKTKNHHESKDVQAFIKVLQKEFSFCSDVPTEWNWGVVNCKMEHLNSMLERMQEYRSLDNDLFKKWDFASDGVGQRLRSYVQSFKKSYGVA